MLKISKVEKANHSINLKLEGRVVGPWVVELRQICDLLLTGGSELKLDLTDVSYVDRDGIATLNSYKSRGVELNNCSPFIEQQIKTVPTPPTS
jgi:hypothetical protein